MARLQHLPLLAWSVLAVLLLSQISNAQQIPPAIEWQKSLGGSGLDAANSIQQTSDGGYIVAGKSCFTDIGMSKIYDSTDYWIVKLTSMGEMEWGFDGSVLVALHHVGQHVGELLALHHVAGEA